MIPSEPLLQAELAEALAAALDARERETGLVDAFVAEEATLREMVSAKCGVPVEA